MAGLMASKMALALASLWGDMMEVELEKVLVLM